jgi:phosphoribosylglycinamide formyltransferase-1
VVKVFTNKADAQVIQRAKNFNISTEIFSKNNLETGKVLQEINTIQPDLIVLAGFLLKFPETIVAAYPDKIINIHPALLPKYGGKGMYGHFVHEAVHLAKETHSGITIHYVNEKYDEGSIVFQERCEILPSDQPEDIARKVQVLEHSYYPTVIDQLVSSLPL